MCIGVPVVVSIDDISPACNFDFFKPCMCGNTGVIQHSKYTPNFLLSNTIDCCIDSGSVRNNSRTQDISRQKQSFQGILTIFTFVHKNCLDELAKATAKC